MQVTVNGKAETFDKEITIVELLAHLKLEPIRVAVEVNEDVIPRDSFSGHVIRDGDRIEIVTFVGGG